MRNLVLAAASLILLTHTALACPTCASTGNQRFVMQTLFALFVLGAVPVLIALFVMIRVRKIERHEQQA